MDLTFGNNEFENVRKSIDINFTSNEIPNATIQLPLYEGEARRIITNAVKLLTEQQQTDHQDTFKLAASLLAAAYIAPTMRNVVSSQLEDERQTYQKRDFEKLADDLINRAFSIVNDVIDEISGGNTEQTIIPFLFATVKTCPK
jgi:cellobiose-specific phosphotransferase system component IIA